MLKQVSGTKTVYGIVISSDTIQRHVVILETWRLFTNQNDKREFLIMLNNPQQHARYIYIYTNI